MSKLDCCNNILFGISNKLLDKLQRVQNCAAKLVLTLNTEHQSSPECLVIYQVPDSVQDSSVGV